MEPHHETGFPATLCQWVGEIVQSSPEAARLTLLELIVGALLASGGHVTQAILALTPRLGWQAYHWMLERGRFRLLGLISALCRIVRREIGERRCFVVIDDTLAPRCSAQAPGVAVRFDHAAKTNRPTFLRTRVDLDRLDGEIERLVARKARLDPEEARGIAAAALDDYVNSLYRSLGVSGK